MKPWEIASQCKTCAKKLFERDREYSQFIFGEVYCNKHIPERDKHGYQTKSIKR